MTAPSRKAPYYVAIVDDQGNIIGKSDSPLTAILAGVDVENGRLKVDASLHVDNVTVDNVGITSVDGATMESNGEYMPVKLTGSIVEKIRNTAFSVTIAAGAYQTFPVSSEMFDKYRVSIRCGTGSGDRKIAVGAAARDDGNADNTGVYPYLEKSISNTGLEGSTNLHGDTWEIPAIAKNMVIYVKNTSASSTVMWITIMGVR